jgi:hypothetical protein
MLRSYSGPPLLSSGPIGSAGTPEDPRVPSDVLAERDRRRTREISVRCDVLGDPEPGRSALDRMQGVGGSRAEATEDSRRQQMFTVKFYSGDGFRQVVHSAESLTILRDESGDAEVTLHQKNQVDSFRVDVKDVHSDKPRDPGWPPVFQKMIVENAAGRTTEILAVGQVPSGFSPGSAQKMRAA